MNTIIAIFTKQLNDFPRNISVSLLFILFPVMAFLMGSVMGVMEEFAGVFASMFVGTTPMIVICMNVAEDREYKSLRFLVMAGVKPSQYLFGLIGFVLLISLIPMAFFAYLGGYSGAQLVYYIIVFVLGLIASSILGASIGIFSKNVQQATAVYTPVMMLMIMGPLFVSVNETLRLIVESLFSYQIQMVVLNPDYDLKRALIVIAINIAVLLTFFVLAYKKKGLRG
jgi:ABC-2 type transport system permease protein